MRSAISILLALAGCWLAGCTPSPAEAPPIAQVSPITQRVDWASAADRPASQPGESRAASGLAASADRDVKPKPVEKPKPSVRVGDPQAVAQAPRRNALFARLPKDAMLVIGVADVRGLRSTFEASELGRMLAQPAVDAQMQPLLRALREGIEQLRAESPELSAALALLPRLGGPAALSISGLSAETLGASPATLPWVATLVYDAGEQADSLAEALAPLLAAQAQKLGLELLEKPEPAWGCEIGGEQVLIDFERRGNVFELRAGGRGSVMREVSAARKRNDTGSFYSAVVARAASDVAALGAAPVFEVHAQFTPLWEALRLRAHREDLRMLERTSLANVHGLSMQVGRTARGLAECLTLHSPAAVDPLSRALTASPLDFELARCVPAELANAGLYSFDSSHLMSDLFLLIPGEAQGGVVRAIADFRREVGVDLEKDVLAVIGPSFAVATHATPGALLGEELPRIFVACQLRDPGRALRSLNALLLAAGRIPEVRQQWLDDVRVHTLELADLRPAAASVHWCVEGDVLLIGTQLELLREGLRGLRGSEIGHAGLKSALAGPRHKLFAAGFTRGDAQTPDSIVLGRSTSAGLELCAADGSAMQSSMAALFFGGIASAIAIPQLLNARIQANEQAAVARLAAIDSAQALAIEARHLDLDHDGLGEYLFLDELAGDLPLRGGGQRLAEPRLDAGFTWDSPGIGVRNGYRYRIDLRLENGERVWASGESAASALDIDQAERSFAVYAWPDRSDSGRAVFVFDPEIGLYSSDNLAPQQAYAGPHAPGAAAYLAAEGFSNDAARRVGRDGGIWLRLRGI